MLPGSLEGLRLSDWGEEAEKPTHPYQVMPSATYMGQNVHEAKPPLPSHALLSPCSHAPLGTEMAHRHTDRTPAFHKTSVLSHADAFTSLSSSVQKHRKLLRAGTRGGRGKQEESG